MQKDDIKIFTFISNLYKMIKLNINNVHLPMYLHCI